MTFFLRIIYLLKLQITSLQVYKFLFTQVHNKYIRTAELRNDVLLSGGLVSSPQFTCIAGANLETKKKNRSLTYKKTDCIFGISMVKLG